MKTSLRFLFYPLLALLVSMGSVAPVLVHAAQGCTTSSEVTALTSDEQQFLDLLNAYRAQNGAGALAASKTLTCASRWMANDMSVNNNFSHYDTLGRDPGTRIRDFGYGNYSWGENIAGGYSSAQNTLVQWQNSPGHNSNMLNPSWKSIGIGRAVGGTYGYSWVTDFGTVVDQAVSGNTTPSDTTAPSVTLSTGSTSVVVGQSVQVQVISGDNTGGSGIAKVELYRNGSKVTESATGNITFTWTPSVTGTSTFVAKAYDQAGNSATSSSINITVTSNSTTQAPTIISFITSSTTIVKGESATLYWQLGGGAPTEVTIGSPDGLTNQLNNTQLTVAPVTTTTYTLTAKNSAGTAQKHVTIQVNTPTTPPVDTGNLSFNPAPGSGYVVQEGATFRYSLGLKLSPASPVSVYLGSTGNLEHRSAFNSSSLQFNFSNWNTPQSVTVKAPDNTIKDGDKNATLVVYVQSADSRYYYKVVTIPVTIKDND